MSDDDDVIAALAAALPYSGAGEDEARAVIDALADAGYEIVAVGGAVGASRETR